MYVGTTLWYVASLRLLLFVVFKYTMFFGKMTTIRSPNGAKYHSIGFLPDANRTRYGSPEWAIYFVCIGNRKISQPPKTTTAKNMGKNNRWIATTASVPDIDLLTSDKDF